MPAPTPVPSVTVTNRLLPRPAPTWNSASAAQLASFSMYSGIFRYLWNSFRSGTSRSGRLQVYAMEPARISTVPGTPTPTEATSPSGTPAAPASSCARDATVHARPSRSTMDATFIFCVASRLPLSSTSPAFRLVPPMSTPTYFMADPLRFRGAWRPPCCQTG